MKTGKSFIVLAIVLSCLCCNKKSNIAVQCTEKPNDGRICTLVYKPVCGCNNKTYGNSCVAEAFGIKEYTEGECKKTTTAPN